MSTRVVGAIVMLASSIVTGSASMGQQRTAAASGPEFSYQAEADRALVERVRARAGTSRPRPIRLEGTLQWKGAGESQRWGITVRWPVLYQQRTAKIIHTLERDVYRTNAGTPPAAHATVRENIRNRYGDLALLLLLRPHVTGMSIHSDGSATVEGVKVRKLVVRNELGPWLTLYVHATEDRLLASGRPWTIDNESVEQLTIIRQRRAVGGMQLPVWLEQVTGKHIAVIKVAPAVGALATVDE